MYPERTHEPCPLPITKKRRIMRGKCHPNQQHSKGLVCIIFNHVTVDEADVKVALEKPVYPTQAVSMCNII
jgi:hypothetical protein